MSPEQSHATKPQMIVDIVDRPVADLGEGPAPPSPLSLDQTEARGAEKNLLWPPPSPAYLRVWMTAPPPPLSEGLNPPLQAVHDSH